jgi:hypothetical protein
MKRSKKTIRSKLTLGGKENSGNKILVLLITIIGVSLTGYFGWYQFFRIDNNLIAKVYSINSIDDTLEIAISVLNTGNRPATLIELRNIICYQDRDPWGISSTQPFFLKPQLPLIIGVGENHFFTVKSLFKPSHYYMFSQPAVQAPEKKVKRLVYAGIQWSAANSSGMRFRNIAVLGGIYIDIIHDKMWCKDTVWSTGSYWKKDSINLFTDFFDSK